MKIIYLDCREMRTRLDAHSYLAKMLDLPSYYGRNLDALYDCLTSFPQVKLILTSSEELCKPGCYANAVLEVIRDAAKCSKNLDWAVL